MWLSVKVSLRPLTLLLHYMMAQKSEAHISLICIIFAHLRYVLPGNKNAYGRKGIRCKNTLDCMVGPEPWAGLTLALISLSEQSFAETFAES